MKKIGNHIWCILIVLTIGNYQWCIGQELKAEISTDSVLMGHYFELRITVDNLEGALEEPSFSEMDIVGGPNQSSSMQIVNGKMSSSQSYTYLLKPRNEGQYILDPIFWTTSDSTYATEPISFYVWPNPEGIRQEHQPMIRQFEGFNRDLRVRPEDELKREYNKKKKLKVTKT